jgi:hypothetical protein
MVFYIENEELKRVFMKEKAFAIMTDTLTNFNQMKGRKMTGFFEEGQISKLNIEGNGESLYFALEGDTLTQGVNRTLSATIELKFKEGAIKRVKYDIKPDGRFIPVQKLDEKSSRLDGFLWRLEEKPVLDSIFAWRPVIEIDPNQKNLFNEPNAEIRMPTEEEIQKSLEKRGLNKKKPVLTPLKTKNN